MLRSGLPRLLLPACATAMLLVAAPAVAQSVTPPSSSYHPNRIVGGQDAGTSTRSLALDPYGINYADCTSGTTLQFSLSAAGFSAGDLLQIWAAPQTTDCGPDSSRLGSPPACRMVANQVQNLGSAATNVTIDVSATTLVNGCTSQPTSAAVPMNVWFIPTDSTGHVLGGSTLYEYGVTTDLVGPSPPSLGQIGVGDTFLAVNWSPSSDPDTFGYDLFLDPPPGTTPPLAPACVEGGTNGGACLTASSIVCDTTVLGAASILPDAGTPDTGAAPDGGAPDSGATAGDDAGVEDGSPATGSTDDAGTGDAGSGLPGGIGTIPSKYLVSPSSPTGITIPTPTTGTYTLNGLENGALYNVVVASVDGSGNVGPASSVQCNYPSPILDFYQTYGTDGGRASGCSLESTALPGGAAAGAAALLLGAGAVRRRRRRLRATPEVKS